MNLKARTSVYTSMLSGMVSPVPYRRSRPLPGVLFFITVLTQAAKQTRNRPSIGTHRAIE